MRPGGPWHERIAWFIAASLAAAVGYFWLSGLAADLYWDLVLGAVLGVGLRAALRTTQHRLSWVAIVVGHLSFLVGDALFQLDERVDVGWALYRLGDAFYLSGYAVIAVGLLALIRGPGRLRDPGGLIDGLVVAVGSAAFIWVILMAPQATDHSAPILDRIVGVAYPAGDLLLITIGAQVVGRRLRIRSDLGLLTVGLLCVLVTDLAYVAMLIHGGYASGDPIDVGWWCSYVFVAAAALWHRADEHLDAVLVLSAPTLTSRRLVVLAIAALASPSFLAVRLLRGDTEDAVAIVAATAVLFVLVVLRLALVTRQLEESREQLWYDATHDALTALANRALCTDRLAHALAQRRTSGATPAVLCLDLDDFKAVNDRLGHGAGDRLLTVVAQRLQALIRPGDTVGRLGGDEFVLVLDDAPPEAAIDIAERVIEAVRQPIDLGGARPAYPNVSVGICFGDRTSSAEEVLRDADIAMYLAKGNGKGRWEVFQPGMRQHVVERLELRADLRDALAADQFDLRYQPVVSVRDGSLHTVEALLRWQHPTLGEIEPARFIAIAEETELIVSIGRWVLHEACRQAQAWSSDPGGVRVAVNLSPVQLGDPGLTEHVRQTLTATGLVPGRLVLELTESVVVDEVGQAARQLRELRSLGVGLAVDDFGAGYTSLRLLSVLPVNVLKIDRSFVASGSDNAEAFLRGIIDLADELGIDAVAEGVETVEQLDRLVRLGCQYAQGYLISHPLPAAEMGEAIARADWTPVIGR